MTVEAVPRTARMTITRIIQAGTGANQSRTSVRTVVNEGLGVAKAGNACTAIRWVAGRLLSQYLLSIVFKGFTSTGEELPHSVALLAATACVEYRSAWTPAFAG